MKDNITRVLHWGFALLIFVILAIGFYMTRTEFSPVLYKSLGIIFSLLMGLRLYWQIRHPWRLALLKNKLERNIRGATHWLLMLLFFVLPLLGIMCSGFSGFGISIFDIEIIPENFNASGEVVPFNDALYKAGKSSHKLLAKVFAAALLLHIAAALKHHFINKDSTLIKMLRNNC